MAIETPVIGLIVAIIILGGINYVKQFFRTMQQRFNRA